MTFGFPTYTSPTLLSIREQDLANPPPAGIACRHCPSAMWMASEGASRAYCRVMHMLVWSPDEMSAPNECDGQVMSMAEMDQKESREQ